MYCRYALEKAGQLDPRISVLDEEFDEAAIEAEAAQVSDSPGRRGVGGMIRGGLCGIHHERRVLCIHEAQVSAREVQGYRAAKLVLHNSFSRGGTGELPPSEVSGGLTTISISIMTVLASTHAVPFVLVEHSGAGIGLTFPSQLVMT
jgi:hypothetical protein